MRRILCLLFIILTLGSTAAASAAEGEPKEVPENPWSVNLRVKNYFKSHTSYEFGNPFPPGQAPLSRLEFPMDSWWAGAEVRRTIWRFTLGIEALRSVSTEVDGIFKDSDWTDDENPHVKTIYSESNLRLDPSYSLRGDLDMKVSDWMQLPVWLDLRPVVGVRWQRLAFVTHDGTQYSSEDNTNTVQPLPGDGINFHQTYWQYFIGMKAEYDLGRHLNLWPLKLRWQVDWAYVEGNNKDHHLLRAGNRYTYETTTGDAWHASIGLKVGLIKNLNAGVELDYLRIQTTGSHRIDSSVPPIDLSWRNGVKVWSEQINLMLNLEYVF